MPEQMKRTFYFNIADWTWWVWLVTAVLIALGVAGNAEFFRDTKSPGVFSSQRERR